METAEVAKGEGWGRTKPNAYNTKKIEVSA